MATKTLDIVSNIITTYTTNGAAPRASGGPVLPGQTYLVGEKGPELLTLGSNGGFVTTASRSRQILSAIGHGNPPSLSGSSSSGQAGGGADQPITVNVMISQEHIAGIANVEIKKADRATKRTVLAGSGVTY